MFQRVSFTLNIIFILLLFTHMKMKKMLFGAFLGMFAVAGIAVLPNYASAQEEGVGAGENGNVEGYNSFGASENL